MTAKEKAKELVDKYYTWGINKEGQTLSWFETKQCALIAVDFALEYVTGDLNEAFDKTLYLLEVKEEIEKL